MKNLVICSKCKEMAEIEKTPIVGDFIRCSKCGNRDEVIFVDDGGNDSRNLNLIFSKPAPEEMELVIPDFRCYGCGYTSKGINARLDDTVICPDCDVKWKVVNSLLVPNKLAWNTSYGTYTQSSTISIPKKKEEPKQKENMLEQWECPCCGETSSCSVYGGGTVRCKNRYCGAVFTAHFSNSAQQFYLRTMAGTSTYTVDGGIFDEEYFPRYTGPCKKTQFVDWTCYNCGKNHKDTRVLETDTTCSCSGCNKTFTVTRGLWTKKAEITYLEIPKEPVISMDPNLNYLTALDKLGDLALARLDDLIKDLGANQPEKSIKDKGFTSFTCPHCNTGNSMAKPIFGGRTPYCRHCGVSFVVTWEDKARLYSLTDFNNRSYTLTGGTFDPVKYPVWISDKKDLQRVEWICNVCGEKHLDYITEELPVRKCWRCTTVYSVLRDPKTGKATVGK